MSKSETQKVQDIGHPQGYNKDTKRKGANAMKEFYITNIHTNKENTIFGYSSADAFRRANLSPNEWTVDWVEYID